MLGEIGVFFALFFTFARNKRGKEKFMGTIYLFLADGFEEMEAFASVDVLRRAGLKVAIVSVTPGEIVKGTHGISVLCDKNIENCDFYDLEMVLLPGGMPGAATLAECEELHKLLLRVDHRKKPIAAICAAPMVLGKLGLLKGKRATCYPGFEHHLEGANYTAAMVEKDDNIITGKGPGAAFLFALAIVEHLLGKEKVEELKGEMLIP